MPVKCIFAPAAVHSKAMILLYLIHCLLSLSLFVEVLLLVLYLVFFLGCYLLAEQEGAGCFLAVMWLLVICICPLCHLEMVCSVIVAFPGHTK